MQFTHISKFLYLFYFNLFYFKNTIIEIKMEILKKLESDENIIKLSKRIKWKINLQKIMHIFLILNNLYEFHNENHFLYHYSISLKT